LQIADARHAAAGLREQSKVTGVAIIAEMREQAQADARQITEVARPQVEADWQQAYASLRADVGPCRCSLRARSSVSRWRMRRDRAGSSTDCSRPADGAASRALVAQRRPGSTRRLPPRRRRGDLRVRVRLQAPLKDLEEFVKSLAYLDQVPA
jgi:hypothetical protein